MADNFISDEEFEKRLRPDYKPENDNSGYLSDEEFNAKLGGEQSGGSSLLRRGIVDPLVGLAKGTVVGIPEAGYGLTNLVTGGLVGRGVDKLNEMTGAPTGAEGFRKANEFFDSMLSPETQAAKQRVNEAQGFLPTAAEYFKNPSTIVQGIAENAPGMLSMAGLGKAGLKVLGKGVLTGDALKEALTLAGGAESVAGKAILKENARRAALGAAIGEGVYTAGQNTTGIMEVQGSDVMTPKQLALAAGSGFVTGLISRMSGGLANRLKIADVDQLLQGSNMADLGSITKVVTAMLKSAIMEGAVEELPQSAQEMYAMNLALGKEDPWEGVAEASASGLVIGSAMGVGGVAGAKLRMAIHKADPLTKQIEEHMNTLPQQEEEIGGRDNTGTILQDMANQEVAPTVAQTEQIVTPEVQPTQPIAPEPITETPEMAQPEVANTPNQEETVTNKTDLISTLDKINNDNTIVDKIPLSQLQEIANEMSSNEELYKNRYDDAQHLFNIITDRIESNTTTETPSPITTTPEGTMRVATPKSQAIPHPSEFNTFNEYATALGYNAPPDMPIGEFAKTNAAQMAQNNTNASELTGKWNKRGKEEVKTQPISNKSNWRQAFDSTDDVMRKGDILRAIADASQSTQELQDVLSRSKGLPEESNINWAVEQKLKSIQRNKEIADEEITQITSDIGQNRGRELPAGTISRSNPMPNDTTTINARTAIGKIAKAFGKSVVWVDINDENEVMFSGLVSYNLPNRIIINAKTKIPHLIILGHEIFHEMKRESPELYQKFRDYIIPLTQNTPKFKKLLSEVYKKQGLRKTNVPTDLMYEELMSEFAGEQFISREFWENMAKTNPTLFEKVIDIARKMINQAVKALGANKDVVGEQYFKDVQTARKMLADVMGEYSKGKLKGEIGEGVKYSAIPYIDELTSKFFNNPQTTYPQSEIANFRKTFVKSNQDFKLYNEYFGLPWWNAKKDKYWKAAFEIFGINRPEKRGDLMHQFVQIAEPFYTFKDKMKKAGMKTTQIQEAQKRINRALIAGDALLGQELANLKGQLGSYEKGSPEYNKIAERISQIQTLNRYSDEELTNGFVDEYGNTIKLQPEEIAVYKSVREALDNMFTEYSNHLSKQAFRTYRNQKWYAILAQAAGFDLNKSQTETILGEGLKKTALLKARKIQPNVQTVFDSIEGNIENGTIEQEAVKAGKLYAKLAEKMGKSIAQLEEAVAYLTNESDKKKVRAMTEDLLNAYVMTRPNMKKIKDLRNSYQQQTAYFPRVREQGKFKVKLVEDLYNKEGMPIGQKEHFMKMFDRESEGVKVIKEIMDKYAKNGNLPANYHISGVERAISTPEFAYQGVNDINMQKVFDDAIEGLKIKEKVFDEEGNPVDVQDLIQDLGYQAIAKQFQSRGFAKRGIHRNPELVKGYEENDLQKILKNYMSGMTGIMTKQEAAADFLALMKDVSKENKAQLFSSLAKYGRGQLRNETKADEISSFARSAMFTWYLGGVVRPALIQLTQNFVTGIPKHAEYLRSIGKGGLGRADKEYTKAMRDIVGEAWGQNVLTPEEKEMEKRLLTEGVTVDQYIREIFGSIGPEHRRKFNKAMSVLATPFSKMEMFNRQSAALTRFRPALEIAKKKVGTKIDGEVFTEKDAFNEAFNSARDYVYDTHYAMSKANLPLLAQGEGTGVALKTLYTFKSFMHNFILSTLQQDWKTTMHSMAYMALFGGLMGLPFMKDIFEWVEREFGMSYTKSIRQTLRGIGGKTLENFGVNGLPAMLGANISGSLAIGVPFMGEDNMQTIGGVYEGQALKFKRAWDALKRGDYTRVAQNISPEFFRSPLTAVEQSQFGKEVFGRPGMAVSPTGEPILNAQGKPLSMTTPQAAFKAMGFNPTDYGREQEMNQIIRRQEKWVTEKKANIAQTLKFDRLNGDPNALTKAKKATDELKQGIKDRGIQDLVPRFTFTDIVKASKKKPGAKERREARYKREELS